MVAPFWTDNDIRREGNVSYEVFQAQATGAYGDQLLDDISRYIRERNASSNFSGSFMILAEWRDVHPYPHGSSSFFDNIPFFAQVRTYIIRYKKIIGIITGIIPLEQHLPSSSDHKFGGILCVVYI